ncbi:MAG: sorbosone dehydrogenase family protein [Hyphomicrobiaceae bacterium]|nr:sorbosone dehydrogenase family protein [Hyphomicrobiaceae bacterium]
MSFSSIFARLVAIVGGTMILLRRQDADKVAPAMGDHPTIPKAVPQTIPTLKMPTARGWRGDEKPVAAPGLKVSAFARDLKHPRQIYVLPNGDVLAAEALPAPGGSISPFEYAITSTMRRAGALGESANRITLLRDRDGDGAAEERHTFLAGENMPFGMALIGDTFYVGNTDAVKAFAYEKDANQLSGNGRVLMTMKPEGHWTRNLQVAPDGKTLFVSVGSLTNIADEGFEAEQGRACIYALDPHTGENRMFAGGLRNPVGMALEPGSGTLFTVVNERDGLGDETPPDYLTSVIDGGFYGWPFCYWGQTVDGRVTQDPEMVKTALQPDYALGGHTASLGLCWLPEGVLPGMGNGMVIGQHGSWNRSRLSGYRVIFVPFENGRPSGPSRDILTGFLSDDEKFSYGRPVGVAVGPGPCLLLADDVGNVIWRVTGA